MDAQVLSKQQNSFSSMLSVGLGWALGRFSPGSMAVDASVRCRLLPQGSWDGRRTRLPDGSEVGGSRSAARAGQRPRLQPWPFLEAGQRYKPAPVLPVPPSLAVWPVTAAVLGGITRAGRTAEPQQHSPHKQSGTREHLCSGTVPGRVWGVRQIHLTGKSGNAAKSRAGQKKH